MEEDGGGDFEASPEEEFDLFDLDSSLDDAVDIDHSILTAEDNSSEDDDSSDDPDLLTKTDELEHVISSENLKKRKKISRILKKFSQGIYFSHYDLLDQVCGREFFVIDGESLVVQLMKEKDVDWEVHGGEMLHLVYVVEEFVSNLVSREMIFSVIFVDFGELECPVSEGVVGFRMARKVVMETFKRLMGKLKKVDVVYEMKVFQAEREGKFVLLEEGGDFVSYLMERKIAFMLGGKKTFYTRLLTCYVVLALKLVWVQFPIEFKATEVYGFASDPKIGVVTEKSIQLQAFLKQITLGVRKEEKVIVEDLWLEKTRAVNDLSLRMGLWSSFHLLKQAQESSSEVLKNLVLHCNLWFLCLLIQPHISLDVRNQRLKFRDKQQTLTTTRFILPLFKVMNYCLSHFENDDSFGVALSDLMSGQLLHSIGYYWMSKCDNSIPIHIDDKFLPKEIVNQWKTVNLIFDNFIDTLQLSISPEVDNLKRSHCWLNSSLDEINDRNSNVSTPAQLLPIENSLTKEYLKDYKFSVMEDIKTNIKFQYEPTKHWSIDANLRNAVYLPEHHRIRQTELKDRLQRYTAIIGNNRPPAIIEVYDPSKITEKDKSKGGIQIIVDNEMNNLKNLPQLSAEKIKDYSQSDLDNELNIYVGRIQKVFEVISLINRYSNWNEKILEVVKVRIQLEDSILIFLAGKIKLALKHLNPSNGTEKWTIVRDCVRILYLLKSYCKTEYIKQFNIEMKGKTKAKALDPKTDKKGQILKYTLNQLSLLGYSYFARLWTKMEEWPKNWISNISIKETDNSSSIYELQLINGNGYDSNIFRYLPKKQYSEITSFGIKLDFEPDPWQKEFIQAVNKNNSILVSAPTSSGKTFVSLYLIEKVLRESSDGIVVFISPTKALVNQMFAEISSKFQTTVGMFTADYKLDVLNCRVLVAVPATLEILYLSPTQSTMINRIKYIILDEIHCMNESGAALYYEHLILLASCPIVGLSATFGNPGKFSKWLSIVNPHPVKYIYHDERPQTLEYHMALFNEKDCFLSEVHPTATINPNYMEESVVWIKEMSPRQCLDLIHSLKDHLSSFPELSDYLLPLSPDEFFKSSNSLLTRSDYVKYAKALHQVLIKLSVIPKGRELISKVIKHYNSDLDIKIKKMEKVFKETVYSHKFEIEKIVPLVMEMKKKDWLPSLVFHFDRNGCDRLLKELTEYVIENNVSLYNSKEEETMASSDIAKIQNIDVIDEFLVKALKKGIAVHHAACQEEYLQEVEMLFRTKKLRIIFATGTLALGVHLPCRTVVMAGYSIYLTTNNFLQCTGRAGRRGFDTSGRIIFYNFHRDLVSRFMNAPIPSIKGLYSLSSSFILRLLSYLEYSNSTSNLNQCIRVLSKPLLSMRNHIDEEDLNSKQLVHHFRYSLEFLRRADVLNANGKVINLGGIGCHLYYTEPYHYAFIYLLQTETLQNYIKHLRETVADKIVIEKLVTILAFMFGRMKMAEEDKKIILPSEIEDSIRVFEDMTIQTYSSYIRSYCSAEPEKTRSNSLPFSDLSFPLKPHPISLEKSFLSDLVTNSEIQPGLSSFCGLSGNTNNFENIHQLINNKTHNISVDHSVVPSIDLQSPISSFIILFWKSGNLKEVCKKCNIKNQNEAQRILTRFVKDIKKISIQLEENGEKEIAPLIRDAVSTFNSWIYGRKNFGRWKRRKRELAISKDFQDLFEANMDKQKRRKDWETKNY